MKDIPEIIALNDSTAFIWESSYSSGPPDEDCRFNTADEVFMHRGIKAIMDRISPDFLGAVCSQLGIEPGDWNDFSDEMHKHIFDSYVTFDLAYNASDVFPKATIKTEQGDIWLDEFPLTPNEREILITAMSEYAAENFEGFKKAPMLPACQLPFRMSGNYKKIKELSEKFGIPCYEISDEERSYLDKETEKAVARINHKGGPDMKDIKELLDLQVDDIEANGKNEDGCYVFTAVDSGDFWPAYDEVMARIGSELGNLCEDTGCTAKNWEDLANQLMEDDRLNADYLSFQLDPKSQTAYVGLILDIDNVRIFHDYIPLTEAEQKAVLPCLQECKKLMEKSAQEHEER